MQRRCTTRALALAAAGLLTLGVAACGDDDDDATTDSSDTTEATAADDTVGDDTAPDDASDDMGDTGDTGDAGDDMGDGTAAGAAVTASGFAFQVAGPVSPGATVVFANEDGAPHTMTADDDAFDTGRVDAGEQGEVTAPDAPGQYAFHCDIHPNMTATLAVVAPAG